MPKRESAPAGDYVLTGIRWRRKTKNGGWELFTRGDVVSLNAEEAARLVGKPHSSFRTPQMRHRQMAMVTRVRR